MELTSLLDTERNVAEAIFKANYAAGDSLETFTITSLSGDVNSTYLITCNEKKIILQKLGPIFDERIVADFKIISTHLAHEGWIVPELLQTVKGEDCVIDSESGIWRAMSFIASDSSPKLLAIDMSSLGQILARFHNALAKLIYQPAYTIPHFHDTHYYFDKMVSYESHFDNELISTYRQLSDAYKSLKQLPRGYNQIIHGDPRLDNILFKENQPFTFIDFDTVMVCSLFVELGDLIRSIHESSIKTASDIPDIRQFILSYINSSDVLDLNNLADIYEGAKTISVELAMRFMIDIVEDSYFKWDTTLYANRKDNHLARIATQMQIHKLISERKN